LPERLVPRRRPAQSGKATMDWTAWFGSPGQTLASAFVVATYSTKTMVPLRIFGILTNLIMIVSAVFSHQYGTMLLHIFLLPMNSYRLYQMLKLIKGVKTSLHEDLNMDWLKPFMTRSQCKKGDVLFAKDAIADAMYYTVSGRYRLTEMGIEIGPGQLIGELGMLAPSNRRTASFECIEDGVLLSVKYSQVEELYYQNPSFGFYFLKISTARLFDNIARLEVRLAQQHASQAAK
jgi:hypothetical protein